MLQRLTGGRTSTGSVGLGATRRAHTLSRISLGPHFSVLSGVRNPPLLPPCRCLSFAPANRGSHTPSRTFFLPDRARRWTGMMGAAGLLALLLGCWCLVAAQELPATGLNGYSLHPPYFNLAEGTKITATATCGEDEAGRSLQDLYCKLVGGPVSGDPSQTIQGQYCDICSQEESDRAHPITNAIDGTERWWQSPPLSRSTEYNEVNVTLDLGQSQKLVKDRRAGTKHDFQFSDSAGRNHQNCPE